MASAIGFFRNLCIEGYIVYSIVFGTGSRWTRERGEKKNKKNTPTLSHTGPSLKELVDEYVNLTKNMSAHYVLDTGSQWGRKTCSL